MHRDMAQKTLKEFLIKAVLDEGFRFLAQSEPVI